MDRCVAAKVLIHTELPFTHTTRAQQTTVETQDLEDNSCLQVPPCVINISFKKPRNLQSDPRLSPVSCLQVNALYTVLYVHPRQA